jgi:hypothetical protein
MICVIGDIRDTFSDNQGIVDVGDILVDVGDVFVDVGDILVDVGNVFVDVGEEIFSDCQDIKSLGRDIESEGNDITSLGQDIAGEGKRIAGDFMRRMMIGTKDNSSVNLIECFEDHSENALQTGPLPYPLLKHFNVQLKTIKDEKAYY